MFSSHDDKQRTREREGRGAERKESMRAPRGWRSENPAFDANLKSHSLNFASCRSSEGKRSKERQRKKRRGEERREICRGGETLQLLLCVLQVCS